MNTSTLWTTVKDELRERREARAAEAALRADLANYRTPSDIEDLLASVDSHDLSLIHISEPTRPY